MGALLHDVDDWKFMETGQPKRVERFLETLLEKGL